MNYKIIIFKLYFIKLYKCLAKSPFGQYSNIKNNLVEV